MSPRAALLAAALTLAAAACTPSAPPVGGPAPDVALETASGPLTLADLRGQQVVLQFAPADSLEAWATLAAAASDLAAEGAVVIGVATDGPPPESPFRVAQDVSGRAAAAYGYTGVPLAVVIDRAGTLRGIAAPRQADDLFALAAPVLLEGDEQVGIDAPMLPVGTVDADAVERLVRSGAALIDLRSPEARAAEGPVRNAIVCPLARLAEDVLPPDVGTPLVLLGPDAPAAAEQATAWGYREVHVVEDATGLTEAPPAAPAERPTRRRAGVRG